MAILHCGYSSLGSHELWAGSCLTAPFCVRTPVPKKCFVAWHSSVGSSDALKYGHTCSALLIVPRLGAGDLLWRRQMSCQRHTA